jgi:hypothetical protein
VKTYNTYETEWYKKHRSQDPDFLDLQYRGNWGEFSAGYQDSFDNHLKKLKIKRNKK